VGETVELLEMSWEVLELARLLYSSDPQYKKELAEVYLAIGDLSMESDNVSQAVADYEQCLTIRQSLYEPDDRRLAEIHYLIGLAQEYQDKKEALNHYQMAHKILTGNILKLESDQDDPQIKELTQTLQELASKMEDLSKGENTPTKKISRQPKLQSSHIGVDVPTTIVNTLPTKRKVQPLTLQETDNSTKKPKLAQ